MWETSISNDHVTFRNNLLKVGEKEYIMGQFMQDKEISPSG